METYKVVLFSLFRLTFFYFGSIETQKLAVLVKNPNNQHNYFVSDRAKTSFGSIYGCFYIIETGFAGHPNSAPRIEIKNLTQHLESR